MAYLRQWLFNLKVQCTLYHKTLLYVTSSVKIFGQDLALDELLQLTSERLGENSRQKCPVDTKVRRRSSSQAVEGGDHD
jgi:hypothetical protein